MGRRPHHRKHMVQSYCIEWPDATTQVVTLYGHSLLPRNADAVAEARTRGPVGRVPHAMTTVPRGLQVSFKEWFGLMRGTEDTTKSPIFVSSSMMMVGLIMFGVAVVACAFSFTYISRQQDDLYEIAANLTATFNASDATINEIATTYNLTNDQASQLYDDIMNNPAFTTVRKIAKYAPLGSSRTAGRGGEGAKKVHTRTCGVQYPPKVEAHQPFVRIRSECGAQWWWQRIHTVTHTAIKRGKVFSPRLHWGRRGTEQQHTGEGKIRNRRNLEYQTLAQPKQAPFSIQRKRWPVARGSLSQQLPVLVCNAPRTKWNNGSHSQTFSRHA